MKKLLKPYLDKLKIDNTELSLAFVAEIQKKHLSLFSFNNMAVLLGNEVSLNLENIVEKIVVKNRGGYCFEHNKLMYEVLKFLGFNVRFVIAKVLNNQKIDVPKTHRITILTFEDLDYLVDVGFGYSCPSEVIKLEELNSEQKYKIIKNLDGDYQLELQTKDGYFTLYKFNLFSYSEADCLMGNFYSSNYKNAVFVNNFVISLIHNEVTLSFRNNIYQKIYKDKKETFYIKTKEELFDVMHKGFDIVVTKEELEILFEKVEKFNKLL